MLGTFFLIFIIAALVITIITLDAGGVISLTSSRVQSLYLIFAPHVVLLIYLYRFYVTREGMNIAQLTMLIEILVFLSYIWIKLNIAPVKLKEDVAFNKKIMMSGRSIALYGLYGGFIQTILYIIWFILNNDLMQNLKLNIPSYIFIIDLVFTILSVLFLITNGMLRIMFTSKRLSIVRRLIILGCFWIPVFNILLVIYTCHLVKLEYDHVCYKVINHKARVDSQVCRTRYPLVMVHGVGFRDLKYLNYWGRIPKELIRNGATIYYANQEAWGTVEANAQDIKSRILDIIDDTGCDKVNIIAHSKGGLDARYAISKLDMGDYVASLTTMSTPHRGSRVIDFLCKVPDKIYRIIARAVNAYFKKIGDRNPDFYTASKQFMTSYASDFNEQVTDVPDVYYQSYCTVMKHFFSDSLLAVPYCIVKIFENDNDGLVSINSAKWGNFRGVINNNKRRGISHGDIIDLKREDYKGFDVMEKYVEIVSELKTMGY